MNLATDILTISFPYSRWDNGSAKSIMSGLDSGPLVLFNQASDSIIISPYSQFMAMSAVYETVGQNTVVNWGIMGAAKQIPKTFQCWTSLTYSGEGINRVCLVRISRALSLNNQHKTPLFRALKTQVHYRKSITLIP